MKIWLIRHGKTEANEITETRTPRKLEISIDNYTTLQDDLEMSEESFCSNDLLLAKTILSGGVMPNITLEIDSIDSEFVVNIKK